MKLKSAGIFIIFFLFLSNITFSYGESLDSIYYEDNSYLYIKTGVNIVKIRKDFSDEFSYLSENKKNNITIEKQNISKNNKSKKIRIYPQELKVQNNYLYHNNIQLLDLKKYDEAKIKENSENNLPLEFEVFKYELNNEKSLYSINIINLNLEYQYQTTSNTVYLLVDNENIKNTNIDNTFEIEYIIENPDKTVWIIGYKLVDGYLKEKIIYHLDLNLNVESLNEKLNKETIDFIYAENENLIVKTYNGLYDVSSSLNIQKRNEDVKILKTHSDSYENPQIYIDKNNQVYFLSKKEMGIMNLTLNKFKYFDVTTVDNEKKVGDVIGSFKKNIFKIDVNIDHWIEKSIPVYEVNKDLCICIEDLQFYGYKMNWDSENRVSRFVYNGINVNGQSKHKKEKGNIYYSDINIYVENQKVPSYNIGGYSLVKLNDLSYLDKIFFRRDFGNENKKFYLKGKINLPNNEVAPERGLNGKIVLYGFGYKGMPTKIVEKPFTLKENQTYSNYEISEKDFDNKIFENASLYDSTNTYGSKFIGYEIDNNYGYINGVICNDEYDLKEDYSMYVKNLNEFEVNYDNFDINIFKKTKVKGSINLMDTINLSDSNQPRYIKISAISKDNAFEEYPFDRISTIISAPENERNINYEIELISGKDYYLQYEILFEGFFPPRYGLVAGRTYSDSIKGYYSKNGFVNNIEEGTAISAYTSNIDNINVNVPIPTNISIGELGKTDIKTYLNDKEITSFNIGGNTAILVKDLKGRGFDIDFDLKNKRIYIKNDLKTQIEPYYDNDKRPGRIFCTDIKTFINNKQINSYTSNQNTIILVKDLKNFGFNVDFDEQKRELKIISTNN